MKGCPIPFASTVASPTVRSPLPPYFESQLSEIGLIRIATVFPMLRFELSALEIEEVPPAILTVDAQARAPLPL